MADVTGDDDHRHDHGHDHGYGAEHRHDPDSELGTQAFWDQRYSSSHRIWSGRPNARLVEHAADLGPGEALDVGCGEGADAVWLAERGWQVIGVDVSAVAVQRAGEHAAEAGVGDRAVFARLDLAGGHPLPGGVSGTGGFDLVTAMFLHLPGSAFEAAYVAMARAVRPGGVLLVAGHHPDDAATGLRNIDLAHLLFRPEQVTATLAADGGAGGWDLLVADAATRAETHCDTTHSVTDTVVMARRRA